MAHQSGVDKSPSLLGSGEHLLPGWRDCWVAFTLVVMVVALYWPTVWFDFVNWDDPWYITNNPLIQSWHPSNLYGIATEVVTRNYAPATIFSFLLDHTLWGEWPGGYHLSNFLLHAVNAVLVYFLLLQLTGNRLIGWTTAALFAIHPVQVETVAWVSSRKGLLSGAFILASLICWLRSERSAKQEVWGFVFFGLALLSKAIAVVVPAVVLLYDVLVLRRNFAEAFARQFVPGLMAIWLLLLTMGAQVVEVGGVRAHFDLNKVQILAIDAVILWRYLGMLLVPVNLCVLYDPPTSGIAGTIAISIMGWVAVAYTLYRYRQRFPLLVFAGVACLIFFIPVMNLFPITTLMNDRYLYLPSIPLFAIVVGGLHRLLANGLAEQIRLATWTPLQRMRIGLLCGISAMGLCFYGQITHSYLPVWKNGLTLWSHAIKHVPELPVVQIQYANTLHGIGRNGEAVETLETALVKCEPDPADRDRIMTKLRNWRSTD